MEKMSGLPSPRVFNTHVPFHWLPTQALEKKTKIVYLLRNPKDIAVSLHNHMRDWTALGYPGSWPDFLHLYMHTGVWCNRWFDNVRDWERQIAAHPDIPVHVAVYEEAIKKKTETGLTGYVNASVLLVPDPNRYSVSGQVGDWKNWFTKEQNEEFDALYKKEMDGCKLNVVFQL
ncbi:sulfotransferase 1C4-like [Littorina saxatilis]|uniref:sulfotransferase 1C4-like n=1 Tax=Littorina saxatilis TaxID=31220 RepID=UPI0038B65447